jgi:choline dehydrogenase
LSEDSSVNVVLLEAGPKPKSIWLQIPIGIGKLLDKSEYTWPFKAETNLDRTLAWTHGKVLAGSGGINGMLFVRGAAEQYDNWAAADCPGWDFVSCLPYFKKLESVTFAATDTRGKSGPLPSSRLTADDQISRAFLDSCERYGLPRNADYNGETMFGAALLQLNTRNGVRWSVEKAYLRPARQRGNLRVETEALVERIIFEGKRAVGVEFAQGSKTFRIMAQREVILSAGALQTPKILELSGVGSPDILRLNGIEVRHALPFVGENLRDHLHARVNYRAKGVKTANDLLNNPLFAAKEAVKYALFRRGLFTTPSFRAHAFLTSPISNHPDVRIQCALTSSARRDVTSGVDKYSGFHIGSYFLYPTSVGRTHVQSLDGRKLPRIEARYLDTEDDIRAALWGVKQSREICKMAPLSDLIEEETRPGVDAQSDEELLTYIRETAETSWHPVGTCKMGNNRQSVVDSQLRVHGLKGLRVADASVMPFEISSNTHIPTIMIGERAADFIHSDRT